MNESKNKKLTIGRRIYLSLAITAAAMIAITPYALASGNYWAHASLAALVFGLASWTVREWTTAVNDGPSFPDFVFGVLGAMGALVSASFVSIPIYGVIVMLADGLNWIGALFGKTLALNFDIAAFWASFVIMLAVILGSLVGATTKLARQLYPETAGIDTAFVALRTYERAKARRLIAGFVVIVAATTIFFVLFPAWLHVWWVDFLLAYALIIVGIPLSSLGEGKDRESTPSRDAVAVGSKLLQYLGYHVVPSPRTGQEDLDPLLINAPDLYAEGEGRGFAVNVKSAGDHVTTDFDYVDNLTASAWALNKFSQENGDGGIRSVESAVLLLGVAEDPVILLHRRRGDLRVVKLTREQAEALGKAASREEVRELLNSCRMQLEAPLDRVAAG